MRVLDLSEHGHVDIKYIAGMDFRSEYGEHHIGEVVEQAPSFINLESLIRHRFLYPVVHDEDYGALPAHVFSAVNSVSELQAMGIPVELKVRPAGTVPRHREEEEPEEEPEEVVPETLFKLFDKDHELYKHEDED